MCGCAPVCLSWFIIDKHDIDARSYIYPYGFI